MKISLLEPSKYVYEHFRLVDVTYYGNADFSFFRRDRMNARMGWMRRREEL